jgi:hypothetical protein
MLLNISFKHLWKYSTLNMQNSNFRGHENILSMRYLYSIENKGFSYSLESQKKGIHMTFKVIKVEGNKNWSIGNQYRIILTMTKLSSPNSLGTFKHEAFNVILLCAIFPLIKGCAPNIMILLLLTYTMQKMCV